MRSIIIPLLIVTLGTAVAAQAQNDTRNAQVYEQQLRRELASTQLLQSLDSPLWMVRNSTLKNAIVFSTLYRDRVDMTRAASKIARLAQTDDDPQNRRLALAALRAIGSDRSASYLARLGAFSEDEYRMIVAGVLTEYYDGARAAAM